MRRMILAAAILVSACTELPIDADRVQTLNVGVPDVRVQLDGNLKSVLTKGDAFSVFYKSPVNELWEYNGETGASSGTISHTGTRLETGDRIAVLYPYLQSAVYEDGMFYTQTSSSQTYAAGTFAPRSAMMCAVASGETLSLSYASAFVVLRLRGNAEVMSIKFSGLQGEKVSGPTWIDVTGPEPKTYIRGDAAGKEISMMAPSGNIVLKGTTDVWFSIPAISYGKGYKFTVSYAGGGKQEIVQAPAVDALPGSVKVLDAVVDNPFTIDVDFTTGQCPFVPVGAFTIPTSTTTGSWTTEEHGTLASDDGRITGPEGDVVRFSYEGKTYEFVIGASEHQWVSSTGRYCAGYYWNPGKFFRFQANNSWLKLPAIEGKSLIAVYMAITCSASKVYFVSDTPSTSGTQFSIPGQSSAIVYLQATEPSKAFYLFSEGARNTQISRLVLYYE